MDLNLGKPVAFSVMAKPIGPICNLNCKYCYYLEKQNLYKDHSDFRMNDEVLEKFIKDYINGQQVPTVSFLWQGGEPTLLGLDFFRKVIALQRKYAGSKKIENSFQTNGTRLDDEWCNFFKQHNFLVGVSIDGPERIHNMYRVYKRGQPTFKDVMRGIELLKKHNVDFNTLSVVNRYNARYPLEVYRFLKKIGSRYMQFLPVVERVATDSSENDLKLVSNSYKEQAKVTDWSVIPEDYGNFLITIFDEWVRNDVGQYYVQMFDTTLASWVGQPPGLCVFSETCGNALAIEHNGDIYSCDHFVFPQHLLGNIKDTQLVDMVASDAQYQFGENKLTKLPQFCIHCDYRFACHGECPKHRFIKTPDGEDGLSYLCSAYKKFFTHVHPFMQFMGEQLDKKQAPANVMQWVKLLDGMKRKS
ncbi:MAG: anaerobic sulfatase-maturation protein [Tenuifilaceae bacterium]